MAKSKDSEPEPAPAAEPAGVAAVLVQTPAIAESVDDAIAIISAGGRCLADDFLAPEIIQRLNGQRIDAKAAPGGGVYIGLK